jgi:hypothetical protein
MDQPGGIPGQAGVPDQQQQGQMGAPPSDSEQLAMNLRAYADRQQQNPNPTVPQSYQPGSDVSSATGQQMQQDVQQPGGLKRMFKGMLAGMADAAMKQSTGETRAERALREAQTSNLSSESQMRQFQLQQAQDLATPMMLPPVIAQQLGLPSDTPISKGQLHQLIDKWAAGEGRYAAKPKPPEEQAFEFMTSSRQMNPADAYAALLAMKKPPDKPDTDKQRFQALVGQLSVSPKFNAALTSSTKLSSLIANSSLSAEDKAFGLGYLATNTTPAAAATNVNLRIGPQWARVQQGQTSLDLKIAKDTGRLPTPDIIQRGQFSAELLPHIPTIQAELEEADKRGLLGPLIGRGTEFMAGKIGSTGNPETDRFYNKLRSDLHLMSSGLNRAHFGGRAGIETLKYFEDLVGGSFRSKDSIFGTLDTAKDYLSSYASAVPGFGQGVDAGGSNVLPEMPTVPKRNQKPSTAHPLDKFWH